MKANNLKEISELLESEHLAYRKCCNYVSCCKDPVLKEKLGVYANNHRIRFETLLNYLNSEK